MLNDIENETFTFFYYFIHFLLYYYLNCGTKIFMNPVLIFDK